MFRNLFIQIFRVIRVKFVNFPHCPSWEWCTKSSLFVFKLFQKITTVTNHSYFSLSFMKGISWATSSFLWWASFYNFKFPLKKLLFFTEDWFIVLNEMSILKSLPEQVSELFWFCIRPTLVETQYKFPSSSKMYALKFNKFIHINNVFDSPQTIVDLVTNLPDFWFCFCSNI